MRSLLFLLPFVSLLTSPAYAQCEGGRCNGDNDGDGRVVISELVQSVKVALTGCSEDTCQEPVASNLPATGQVTCWDSDENVIACAGTGHDGDIRAGAGLDYVDNGDGTVTDLNTGLMWEKQSDDGSIHDRDNRYTWDDAFAVHAATLNSTAFAGHEDWRMPNVKELMSIVNYEMHPSAAAAFDTDCVDGCTVTTCSCIAASDYWSSTTFSDSPGFAWSVGFNGGFVSVAGKHNGGPARAVRGGS